MSESTRKKNVARAQFNMTACMAMMEEMMERAGGEWDCTEMMAQINAIAGIPEEWIEVMSQMMVFCGGTEVRSDESK